ncbi:MAG: hypothetical protein J07HX64_01441 [halophilic archaeon J07HX64]|nr:MAG: hypothetical protein J07HX64_01441 [halophilic archaeon J07HX64]
MTVTLCGNALTSDEHGRPGCGDAVEVGALHEPASGSEQMHQHTI